MYVEVIRPWSHWEKADFGAVCEVFKSIANLYKCETDHFLVSLGFMYF